MTAGLLGQIVQPAAGNAVLPGVEWIADNGIYSNAYPGDGAYLAWLASRPHPDRCRFVVAPDVVADHHATLARSWPMLRRIRQLGLPVALCAQNGATPDDLPWDYIDAVFLAGIVECGRCGYVPLVTDLPMANCPDGHGPLREWKLGPVAAEITAEARRRSVWVHMGRVNSLRRLRYAHLIGCDSADGTYLAFGPDRNLPTLLGWLASVNGQGLLWEAS
jgi:hypothetical protein